MVSLSLLQNASILTVRNPLLQRAIGPLLLSRRYCGVLVATVGHMTHVQLLLAPITVMGSMTSVDHCYYHQQ
jgi:hypothetical protein